MTFLVSIVFMAACAPPTSLSKLSINKPLPNTQTSESHSKKQATTVSAWEISGALSAKKQNKGWSASLYWLQQGPNTYQIRLFGPLGGGAIIIEKKGATITYVDGSKKLTADNADNLFQQQTGLRLPVSDLYYWVRGLPAPGQVTSSEYEGGYLARLRQAGYDIDYTRYVSVSDVRLPETIRLQGHGTVIKLVIKHWKI
jgi:outer membrane lipoprotein LolB